MDTKLNTLNLNQTTDTFRKLFPEHFNIIVMYVGHLNRYISDKDYAVFYKDFEPLTDILYFRNVSIVEHGSLANLLEVFSDFYTENGQHMTENEFKEFLGELIIVYKLQKIEYI